GLERGGRLDRSNGRALEPDLERAGGDAVAEYGAAAARPPPRMAGRRDELHVRRQPAPDRLHGEPDRGGAGGDAGRAHRLLGVCAGRHSGHAVDAGLGSRGDRDDGLSGAGLRSTHATGLRTFYARMTAGRGAAPPGTRNGTCPCTAALKGFAATLPDAAVPLLRLEPLVAYVEPDQTIRADGTEAMDANGDPWGLDRIDQQALPLSGTYTYTSDGAGVQAYIIDTGIWTLHPDFGGRADNVYDALTLDLVAIGEDCNGHGTHVAGTVGGATYGVAKGVSLHGVRVLGCAGVGFTSDVIAGVDWVTANHQSPAVANMSLGGGSA